MLPFCLFVAPPIQPTVQIIFGQSNSVHKRQKKQKSGQTFYRECQQPTANKALRTTAFQTRRQFKMPPHVYSNLCLSWTLSLLVTLPFFVFVFAFASNSRAMETSSLWQQKLGAHIYPRLYQQGEKNTFGKPVTRLPELWLHPGPSSTQPSWETEDACIDLGNYPNATQLFFVSFINSMLKIVV